MRTVKLIAIMMLVCFSVMFTVSSASARVMTVKCDFCDGNCIYQSATDWEQTRSDLLYEDGAWWRYYYYERTLKYVCDQNSGHVVRMRQTKVDKQFSGY